MIKYIFAPIISACLALCVPSVNAKEFSIEEYVQQGKMLRDAQRQRIAKEAPTLLLYFAYIKLCPGVTYKEELFLEAGMDLYTEGTLSEDMALFLIKGAQEIAKLRCNIPSNPPIDKTY